MTRIPKRSTWIWLGKVLLSGIIAFVVLTLFCIVYSNIPVHYATADGATDYRWQPHHFYSSCTEGFSWGRTNNEGYIDPFDYDPSAPVDVLTMGSSHMEATNVAMDESVSGRLSQLMPDDIVYNIGISGHHLLICAQNLKAAVQKYAPSKFILVETSAIRFSNEDLKRAAAFQLPEIPSHTDGIIGMLQKDPFLRLVYHQAQSFLSQQESDMADDPENTEALPDGEWNDPHLLGAILSRMADTAASSGAKLIIVYHPGTSLRKDGHIQFDTTGDEEDAFAALCEENGVYFLSMRERFQSEYEQKYILPHGFSNTSVGTGHLNRYGHEMMAEELYRRMQEVNI